MFDISPSTHTAGNASSSAALSRTVSSETVKTRRSASLIRGSCWELARGREEGVLHEHGHGHEADAARHGGDGARPLRDGVEIHVAGQLAGVQAVDPDVDDDRALLDHVAGDESR